MRLIDVVVFKTIKKHWTSLQENLQLGCKANEQGSEQWQQQKIHETMGISFCMRPFGDCLGMVPDWPKGRTVGAPTYLVGCHAPYPILQ
jgi:hypothetical protein